MNLAASPSPAPSHARLDERWSLHAHLVGTTALHVGTGSETSGQVEGVGSADGARVGTTRVGSGVAV